jgi:monoamine oxidase
MSRSREGFIWTPRESWSGLKTAAAVDQSRTIGTDYDVVVIGAGFAGLTAARDISQQTRLKVLLLDGRDRIGGRAWTANELGREFEMGASWVRIGFYHVLTD